MGNLRKVEAYTNNHQRGKIYEVQKNCFTGDGERSFAATTVGAVYAATGSTQSAAPSAQQPHKGGGVAYAQILGIDAKTLGQELKSGKTLAQIATAKGMDVATLTQKLQTALNDRIDKAVASGKLTSEKAAQIKATQASEIANKINQPWTGKQGKFGMDKGVGQTLQSILGMDATQLKEQLKSGKTLAQIATEKGISKADLTAKLQTGMEANLNKAVTDQKMTADKAAQIKSKIPQMVDRMINQFPERKGAQT